MKNDNGGVMGIGLVLVVFVFFCGLVSLGVMAFAFAEGGGKVEVNRESPTVLVVGGDDSDNVAIVGDGATVSQGDRTETYGSGSSRQNWYGVDYLLCTAPFIVIMLIAMIALAIGGGGGGGYGYY